MATIFWAKALTAAARAAERRRRARLTRRVVRSAYISRPVMFEEPNPRHVEGWVTALKRVRAEGTFGRG